MTDHEAKARSIVKKHDLSAHYVIGGCGDACKCNAGFCELAVSAIASALREVEAGEREACAKIAENALGYGGVPCKQAAALIRSRSKTDE